MGNMDEGEFRVNEDGFIDENGEDSDNEDLVDIDANAEFDEEAELAKLDKQLALLRRRDKAMDMSRMTVVETVKKQAPYQASLEEGYNAKKAFRENKKGR